MKTSQNGIKLLTGFEGCRLHAYKAVPTEQYYTIGYGHYGPDVKADMKITFSMAEEYLKKDLARFENAVNRTGLTLNQNQFDALVSFTYNCGEGSLKMLIKGRNINQIGDALLLYNKSGGKVLEGLNRRRRKERELFFTPAQNKIVSGNKYKVTASVLNVRNGAGISFKVIRTLKKDTVVNVLSFSGDWAKTDLGWCSKQYLQKI